MHEGKKGSIRRILLNFLTQQNLEAKKQKNPQKH